MRNVCMLLTLISFLVSCTNGNKTLKDDSFDKNIRKQAVKVAEIFAMSQLRDTKRTKSKNGLVIISADDSKYLIDPSKIVTGKIDEDTTKDAIVPVYIFRNQTLARTEHLILINKDKKFRIVKVLDSEMKVLAIKERVIYIEISKIASDSPNYGCNICKEIIKYRFTGDSLSKIK